MIHYHGLPITPNSTAENTLRASHSFISFKHRSQLKLASKICQSFAIDNGAFSFWKLGEVKKDWSDYYVWVSKARSLPGFDFAVIPDVIEGTEDENQALLKEWPFSPVEGVPVFHLHETESRLKFLIDTYYRVALGSSGSYSTVGNLHWWNRINELRDVLFDAAGRPPV